MGGPGCSKETQCKNMATKYGFCLVGLGQLLWQEAQSSTRQGWAIQDIMLQGLLVPTGIILDMINDNMPSCPESLGFLIHGFPRELMQTKEFKSIGVGCLESGPRLRLVFQAGFTGADATYYQVACDAQLSPCHGWSIV
ncbi:Adenylate kinase isoenzyme 5 [Pteropus alecto]|uniref:Adenylate kinase isoenzyme 5 n=1 Tax=Pteropus alecto TaxID=9402 RepID=L5L6W2_PTEAL|nr:Adenylate kinase isoenzyme 5 [Pteropus alecto]